MTGGLHPPTPFLRPTHIPFFTDMAGSVLAESALYHLALLRFLCDKSYIHYQYARGPGIDYRGNYVLNCLRSTPDPTNGESTRLWCLKLEDFCWYDTPEGSEFWFEVNFGKKLSLPEKSRFELMKFKLRLYRLGPIPPERNPL